MCSENRTPTFSLNTFAEQEDVIITKNGRPTAVLHHLGEDDLDEYLLEHDPKFRKLIEKRWKDYVAHDPRRSSRPPQH